MTRAAKTNRRAGMSLVELLVVVAILGLLAVTVLPNLANTAESRRTREAARVVSSFVSSAKSRAIGRREWAGFTLVAATAGSSAALDVFQCDVLPPYTGATTPAFLTVSGSAVPGEPAWRTASIATPDALLGVAQMGIEPNDPIRFANRGPFYEIVSFSEAGLTFRFRGSAETATSDFGNNDIEDAGQTIRNTPWPAATEQPFEIFRRPSVTGAPLTMPDGRAIDLRWSGVGPPNVPSTGGTYRQFNTWPVSIMFDGTGRLRQAVLPTQRWVITGAVFLLVGRADRAGQDPATLTPLDDSVGANWQYGDSFWVAIDPFSGVAKLAECVPDPAGATVYDRLIASQRWLREALLKDGR
jgi:prepilin-type N-terminal cleavage/methylation domain-containing protein